MYPGYHNPESAGVSEIPESLMQDIIVTRESLAFVLEHQDHEPTTPWFLCASYSRPHSPLTAPGRYVRHYRGKVPPPEMDATKSDSLESFARRLVMNLDNDQTQRAREAYYASVDFVDDCIGELLDGLRAKSALENTIIIYTSDHGEMLGLYGCWGKQLYHDPSIGVPLLISGPGLPGGISLPHPFSLMDLYPTTCGLAGVPVPEGLDGIDFSGVLQSSAPSESVSPRQFSPSAVYRYGGLLDGLTIEETEPDMAWRCVREQDWKYVEIENGSNLLFNLVDDPLEQKNLATQPVHAERCQSMRSRLYTGFSWDEVHAQIKVDRLRRQDFLSGQFPGTPNQYQLPDGRIFDAEKSLYDARWLTPPEGFSGGIIPQQFG
jgi:choline-sulfatase